jgi:hypothetical protein
MAIDWKKPIRIKPGQAGCERECEYLATNRLGFIVVGEYCTDNDSYTKTHSADLAEARYENIPEVRESWQLVMTGIESGKPIPAAQRESLEACRKAIISNPHRYIAILHLRYDGATLTANVLTTEEK